MSTTTLTTTVGLQITYNHVVTGGTLLNTPADVYTFIMDFTWQSGTAINNADLVWASSRSLAATNETLTFAGGSVSDVFGTALTFVKIKLIAIRNLATTAGFNLTVGNALHPLPLFSAGTATMTIGPDGRWFRAEPSLAGIAVGSGATDSIKIDAGANTVPYQILVIGTDA